MKTQKVRLIIGLDIKMTKVASPYWVNYPNIQLKSQSLITSRVRSRCTKTT